MSKTKQTDGVFSRCTALRILRSKRFAVIFGFLVGCIVTIPSIFDSRTDAGFLAPVIFSYATVGAVIVVLCAQTIVFSRMVLKLFACVVLVGIA